MFEIITAGGWLMLPILTCSVVAMAIVAERCWVLRQNRILPSNLANQARRWLIDDGIPDEKIRLLQNNSPLGRILAAGLANRHLPREKIKNSVEEVGSHVAHELQRFLNALGTIATITPLLGLLGTVIGMISVFTRITSAGVGNPTELAGGISTALITTAAGLAVAIPSLMMYRYFRGRIETLVVDMEQESLKLIDAIESALNARSGNNQPAGNLR
ncbi:biopolymer transporter ExbB [Chromatiales bacterium (ex Bugula neritina AB1)]|nr:biopolymer transporter ExbB [Chromatiales bacterium (ex Bugula neritina AB1)]